MRNFALLQAVTRDLLIAVALINCHRNSLYQHFHIRIIACDTRRRWTCDRSRKFGIYI